MSVKRNRRFLRKLLAGRQRVARVEAPATGTLFEPMENRVLLSASVNFDADGAAGANPAVLITALDWAPGNALSVDSNTAIENFLLNADDGGDRDVSFTTYYHAHLATTDIGTPAGLGIDGPFPADFEITIVLGFQEIVTDVTTTTTNGTVGDPGTGRTTAVFDIAPVQTDNFLRIYYDEIDGDNGDGDVNSNALTGAGYDDGVLILEASIVAAGSNFAISLVETFDGSGDSTGFTPVIDTFDQRGADNYGIDSVIGNGDTDPSTGGQTLLQSNVTFQHAEFFPDQIANLSLAFTSDQTLPFLNVNPSGQFVAGDGSIIIPNLGATNGLASGGGTDIQFETDARNNFELLPDEPLTPEIFLQKFVKPVGEPGGGEGLTPGFWKTHSEYGPAPLEGWPETGYSPDDDFNTVFGVSDADSPTLLEALQRGGGDYNALGRHATAALLNAANPNVDYAFTEAQIIAMVQAAYVDPSIVESTKNQLAFQNEMGADLNTPANGGGGDVDPGPGDDANDPTGPIVAVGDKLMFTYLVSNTGEVDLDIQSLIDDNATPGDFGDDFMPDAILNEAGTHNIGDLNMDGLLNANSDEVWAYTYMIVAEGEGQFMNIAKVTATPVDETGTPTGQDDVMDEDPAHWFVSSEPGDPGDPDDGEQGLTPGFWKQAQHFEFWTDFAPGDSFNDVFGVNDSRDLTLLEALQPGGPGATGDAFTAHAVAALLNAANADVNYLYTVNEVIGLVQGAYASGNFESVKDMLETQNEKEGVDLKDSSSTLTSLGGLLSLVETEQEDDDSSESVLELAGLTGSPAFVGIPDQGRSRGW